MPRQAVQPMTQDEFLTWIQTQEHRYELVDGVPVAMAGAKRRHDQVVVNLLGELRNQLRRTPCRPFSADTTVRIPAGNIRFPDAGVDCGAFQDEAVAAAAPALVIEVLPSSTRDFDLFTKLEEYKTVPGLRHVLIVNPDEPQVVHWARSVPEEWGYQSFDGLDTTLDFPDLALRLALIDLYEGLEFRPRLRLVEEDVRPGRRD